MKRRQQIYRVMALLLIFSAMLSFTLQVSAGGWAVITLDELPIQVVANQPLTVGFMIRQHGHTPASGYTPQVTASHLATNETVTVTAQPQGDDGHYVATLTLPLAGVWQWTINPYGFNQPMPPLTVIDAPPAADTLPLTAAWPLGAGLAGLIGLGLMALAWRRRPRYWLLAVGLVALATSGLGFIIAALDMPKVDAQTTPSLEVGQALFVAKGCPVCHRHEAIERTGDVYTDAGPELTGLALTPDYLRLWLQDPAAVKPNTLMPNLNLSQAEIEALIAFLTALE